MYSAQFLTFVQLNKHCNRIKTGDAEVKCSWCKQKEAVGTLDERWPVCMECSKKACLLILGAGKKLRVRVKEVPK